MFRPLTVTKAKFYKGIMVLHVYGASMQTSCLRLMIVVVVLQEMCRIITKQKEPYHKKT